MYNRLYCISYLFNTDIDIAKIQKMTKQAVETNWKQSMSYDWIHPRKAHTFNLMDYYTHLKWAKITKTALEVKKESMKNIFEILDVQRAGEEPTNILVECNYCQLTEILKLNKFMKCANSLTL